MCFLCHVFNRLDIGKSLPRAVSLICQDVPGVPAVLALFLMLRFASLSVCVLASAKQLKQNFELSLCVCWSCPKYVDVWKGLCQVAKPIFFGRGFCTWYFQSTVLFSPQTFSGTETGWLRDEARNGAKNCHNDSCEGLDRLGGTG